MLIVFLFQISSQNESALASCIFDIILKVGKSLGKDRFPFPPQAGNPQQRGADSTLSIRN